MRYIIILFLLVSNCQQESVVEEAAQESYLISNIDFDHSEVQLEGSALKNALEWNEYQSFVTGMENYDHSLAVTIQLQEYVNEMIANPNDAFKNLPITSRIKILQTRLGIYGSFLTYSQKSEKDHLTKFNAIVKSWDELKTQMNVKFNEIDQTKQKLIDQLKSEKRQDAQLKRKDSIKILQTTVDDD
jgi:hypothetical protein